MARLKKNDIKRHRYWLSNWHTPEEVTSYIDPIIQHIGSVDFFNQAGLTFLHEAWLAAEFGEIRNIAKVRLVNESHEWPDFEACDHHSVEPIECVEAVIPGRRRGDEYREREENKELTEDPVENWIERAGAVPRALDVAIKKKTSKNYNNSVSLLVYLNIYEYGIRTNEIENEIYSKMDAYKIFFHRIYVLWKKKIYASDDPRSVPAPS
ncbi:hypothetical protein AA0242T_1195 [Acetobacter aceti NRIC 0242]|uniref:Uncharacterized protein n=1 Tax=Acetobacter aceti NBRC 14818 TaxID=887700 RepID=A0AB33IHZ8_ACEAC|nr:hypothetical protein [Acetobacter aceti]TCS34200.1 hypothetical protein EDC15_104144 [Acetobacter aceti NBRC 14818]BCK75514.1 hypothetical protein EMQ_1120 [Acetobacter aceti NBRC 14818]GAN56723.1 hypothetical protein Abac_009_136 [Acetobacter aceti NBRC 14818]GBO80493.1 hypothetical protein AA0242T_1195 [Acetobacter aceti NRIC 0242]